MNLDDFKHKIRSLLPLDIEKTISKLSSSLEENSELGEETLLLNVKYQYLKKEFNNNIISRENYSIEFTKIISSIISIINKLTKESLKKGILSQEDKTKLNLEKRDKEEFINLNVYTSFNNKKYKIKIRQDDKTTEIFLKILLTNTEDFIMHLDSFLYYPVLNKNNKVLLNSYPIKEYDIKNNDSITLYSIKAKTPLEKRLLKDFIEIFRILRTSNKIFFEIKEFGSKEFPKDYLIEYRIDSITGINKDRSPIIKNNHKLEIKIPTDYPKSSILCYFLTDVWHPNIKYDGKFKGRIQLLNDENNEYSKITKDFLSLVDIIVNIGKMLQYKLYNANQTSPFPEDISVAKWVKEFAEKKNIVNKEKSIFIDESFLLG